MRQSNLYEFLEDFEEALRQELHHETCSEDTSETDCQDCEGEPLEPEQESTSLIDKVITRFLEYCYGQAALPTLEQAQAIDILDKINSKYNKA